MLTIKNRNVAFSSYEEIKCFQEQELRKQLEYVLSHSLYYQRIFNDVGVDLDDIRSLEDLSKLPVTTKDDLQKYNDDFICCDKLAIRDYVTTSGTLGEPVKFVLTENDLKRLAYNEASSFTMAGICRGEVIQLMTTMDRLFMAGLAYFLGSQELGCGIVRVGNGIPELQWQTIMKMKSTMCIVVPSFLLKLIDFAEKNNIDYRKCTLKKAICIGEALYNQDGSFTTLGKRIKEKWKGLELFSTYASTEMQSSYTECVKHNGCHVPVDLIITEYLDENNLPVKSGEAGELTITTLGVEGMPLVRFKTGDICIHYDDVCSCGRHSTRLSSILGRRKQMIKFKGTTLYPPAIFDILDNIPDVESYVVEVFTNNIGTDGVQIKVASDNPTKELEKQIKDIFRSRVRVAPDVIFTDVKEINRLQTCSNNRKIVKFFDLRK